MDGSVSVKSTISSHGEGPIVQLFIEKSEYCVLKIIRFEICFGSVTANKISDMLDYVRIHMASSPWHMNRLKVAAS